MEKMTKNSYLFKMSVPIFIELLLQLLVGNIDQIMVSRYSQASVAAIVNGNQIMNIIIITINMLCMATTVVLTQCLGAEDRYKSNQLCLISMMVISGVSLPGFGHHAVFQRFDFQDDEYRSGDSA